jgi:Catalytic LigB subunit of aromatic ring-opening dioxygenase
MARLVTIIGAPHRPSLPQQVAQAPGTLVAEGLLDEARQHLEAAAPDVLIELATDHFTNFWYHNMPAFCVGLIDEAPGPEPSTVMPKHVVQGHPRLARDLLQFGLSAGFDLSSTHELLLDHSIMVPLHFLTPAFQTPVVPLYTNGIAPPFPTAERCLQLGRMLKRFIEGWDSNARVGLVISGSFALEVGGPKVGWTDQEWVDSVLDQLGRARYDDLAREATYARMAQAGNASGELLNWIVATGSAGEARPVFLEDDKDGNGYAAWRLE